MGGRLRPPIYIKNEKRSLTMIIRTALMRSLSENYESQGNHIILLYGRNGCEKEALLRVYLKDKKRFYYRARQASQEEQYRQMAAEFSVSSDVKLQKGTYAELFSRVKAEMRASWL